MPGTNPRNNCAIKTAPGFTTTPNGRFTGTYQYNQTAGQVSITWTRSTVNGSTVTVSLAETWTVSTHGTALARMELSSDNYSLTGGIGYGSNAGLDQGSKAPMSEIRTRTETFWPEGQSWNRNTITNFARGTAGGLTMDTWLLCDDGSCLGNVQYNAGCSAASCCAAGDGYEAGVDRLEASGNRRFYYMSGQFGGRRNTYEFWCECLSYEACYTYNSHVRPLLQVVDDTGRFRGWVGAEVSPRPDGPARRVRRVLRRLRADRLTSCLDGRIPGRTDARRGLRILGSRLPLGLGSVLVQCATISAVSGAVPDRRFRGSIRARYR